jgi:hypothetical protein
MTPPIQDDRFGSLFYSSSNKTRSVSVNRVRSRRGKEISDFLDWKKWVWEKLVAISKRREIHHWDIVIGDPIHQALPYSQVNPEYVQQCLLARERDSAVRLKKRVPCNLEDLTSDEQFDFDGEYGKMFWEMLNSGAEISRSKLTQFSGEPLVRLDVNDKFAPCTILDQERVQPGIVLFDLLEQVKLSDPIVFNGEELPWY